MGAVAGDAVPRNAPCPCGSGRRYKECHGRFAAPSAGAPGSALTGALVARMREALAAQRAGRFDEAIAGYDEVIRGAPDTFDAWHMRGVSHLQSHRFDAAEADIAHALALCPELPLGRSNLALVESGRRSVLAEERVSCAALPRFWPLVVDPAVAPLEGLGSGMRCFVVEIDAGTGLAERLGEDARRLGALVHRLRFGDDGWLGASDESLLGAAAAGDVIVAAGTGVALGDWTLACAPHAIALVVDGAGLAPVQDRLRELSGQGRRRVRLAATSDAPVDLDPLPHWRMAT